MLKNETASSTQGAKLKMQSTVQLDFPIEVDGATVNTVTMRRSKVIDHRLANQRAANSSNGSVDYELELFSILTDIPRDAFDQMDYGDYSRLQETYRGFLSSVSIAK